ncbi:hypothetical protein CK231_10780 [Mesorhizobium loti]|uniref:hypothetical protein n=1 Tax=Mesorhizobium TaxID=68287 RepID=UPI000BAEF877|nr:MULTISPECIES: hypothetical protein [Mesorhizobium]PBB14194.1 hypothetical protein CK231_10780 [Mesorhizobium loti]PBC07329.1 hypothetical protein CK230_27020 [Mesorhizobium sp. WSM3859]
MSEEIGGGETANDWAYLWDQIKRRTFEPVKAVPFVIYILLGIVLFGGLGIWTEALKVIISDRPPELAGLLTAVMTFFPTLIGSTAIQLVLASSQNKILMSFALFILFVFLAVAILLPFFSASHPWTVLTIASIASVCAIWTWWFTNSTDPIYRHRVPIDAPSGGPTNNPLKGNLSGFQV